MRHTSRAYLSYRFITFNRLPPQTAFLTTHFGEFIVFKPLGSPILQKRNIPLNSTLFSEQLDFSQRYLSTSLTVSNGWTPGQDCFRTAEIDFWWFQHHFLENNRVKLNGECRVCFVHSEGGSCTGEAMQWSAGLWPKWPDGIQVWLEIKAVASLCQGDHIHVPRLLWVAAVATCPCGWRANEAVLSGNCQASPLMKMLHLMWSLLHRLP